MDVNLVFCWKINSKIFLRLENLAQRKIGKLDVGNGVRKDKKETGRKAIG